MEVRLDNGQDCDFVAETTPSTWWEIKAVRDLKDVEQDYRVALELQNRLRDLPQPYVLHLAPSNLDAGADIGVAAKDIRKQLAKFHERGGTGTRHLHASGLNITIGEKIRSRDTGYLAIVEHEFLFDNTQMGRIHSSICSALPQLPQSGPGIVVVDATGADWLHVDDLKDACFGEDMLVFGEGYSGPMRASGGVFQPRKRQRIGAVAYYNRTKTQR